MSTEAQIAELQIKLSFQEELVESLNQALVQQELRLQALERQLERVNALLVSLQFNATGISTNPDERPPHY